MKKAYYLSVLFVGVSLITYAQQGKGQKTDSTFVPYLFNDYNKLRCHVPKTTFTIPYMMPDTSAKAIKGGKKLDKGC